MKTPCLLVFMVTFLLTAVMVGQTLQQDSLALVALYNSTDGPNWNNNTNCLTAPVSTWYGIIVNDDRVTEIHLDDNALNGPIPSEIGNLSALERCYLHDNQLNGSIPPAMGQLSQLTILILYNNQLNGLIPGELGNLSQLNSINLGENQLIGNIPAAIWNLENLESLALYDNQLYGSIPPAVGNLTKLTNLSISSNQFGGTIPSEIGNLISLTYLDLFSNQFTGALPESMKNLVNLQQCNLFNNQFTDLPDLSSITPLTSMKIENNRFVFDDIEPHVGIITFEYTPQDSIGESYADSLETGATLSLFSTVGGENNQYQWFRDGLLLSGANESEYQKSSITIADGGEYTCEITNSMAPELTLYRRPIQVTVEWSGFHRDSLALQALFFNTDGMNWTNREGWFMGPLSNDWFGITLKNNRVTQIQLYNNNLNGTLPPEIGSLDSLIRLELWLNPLSGQLPAEICGLKKLSNIRITRTEISGFIPEEIGNLENLVILNLSSNELTGSIPASMGQLDNLLYLNLASNEIEGEIPLQIGQLQNLMSLSFSFNNLSGLIPPEIGGLINLEELYCADNQLSGPIPAELGNLIKLKALDLYKNQLEDAIPPQIGQLAHLKYLYLTRNQLTGPIPPEIGNIDSLLDLRLSINLLEGPIPGALGKLSNLFDLELDRNQLSGEVPDSLTQLSNLSALFLYGNQLTGLPDLSGMDSLNWLEIQDNQFTFEDIEPNVGIEKIVYSPQDSVGEAQDTIVIEGASISFSVEVGGSANLYQWMKNDEVLIGSDSTLLEFPSIAISDSGTYVCQITNPNVPGLTLYSQPIRIDVIPATSVDDRMAVLPKEFALLQNWPNPFNPVTQIQYHLPAQSDVKLYIYNITGEEVNVLVDETQLAGVYEVIWDGQSESGIVQASGIYFFRLEAVSETERYSSIRKMMFLK